MNKKSSVLILLGVLILISLAYFNLPSERTIPISFGTYLDIASYQKGYSFSTCTIDSIDFSTDINSSFYFGCNLDRGGPDYPIGFIATFPFHVEKIGKICYTGFLNLTCPESGICKTIFNKTDHDMCIKPTSDIDDGYILWAVFNDSNEALSPTQFFMKGMDIFHRVYPERLRFEMTIASQEVPISVNYCREKGWGEGCARLKLPNRLNLILRVPKDGYKIEYDQAFSPPSITYKEDIGGYEISWDLKKTSTVRFDLIDKNIDMTKTIANQFGIGILFIIIGIFIDRWWTGGSKKRTH